MSASLVVWAILGLVCLSTPVQGQIAVTDATSNLQRTIEFFWKQGQEVKKYAEMVETVRKLSEQVKGTYKMLEYAEKNVENMIKEGDMLTLVTTISDQTSSILGQVQYLGFNLDRTSQQFENLYRNTSMLTTPAGRAQRYRELREARMEMTGIAMQTQSIRQTFTDIYSRLATLLGISSYASGQKALQQLQMQQQALSQKQQQLALSMQAVHARLVAMEQAERMLKDEMFNTAAEQLAQEWYRGAKPLLPPGYQGFRILAGAP